MPNRSARWVVLMISVRSHFCTWFEKESEMGKKKTFSLGWKYFWKLSGSRRFSRILQQLQHRCVPLKYLKDKNLSKYFKLSDFCCKRQTFFPKCNCNFLLISYSIVWVIKLLSIDWFPAFPLLSVYLQRDSRRSIWQALNSLPWQHGGKVLSSLLIS